MCAKEQFSLDTSVNQKYFNASDSITEQQYRKLMESLPYGIILLRDDKFLTANSVFMRLFSIDNSDKLIGYSFYALLQVDYQAIFKKHIHALINLGNTSELLEEKLLKADGAILDLEIGATVINIENKDTLQITFKDISRRKAVERALKQSVEEFQQLAETMPQFVWTARPDGWIDYMNSRWFDYTGQTIEETQGWGWETVMHPDDIPPCIARWTEALNTGNKYEMEYRYKRAKDGTYRWHLGRASAIKDENGNIIKWIGTSTEIHDHKIAEEKARKLNQELELRVKERTSQLELANQELESFSYSVSHDLRAPLRHIVSFVELLEKHLNNQLDDKAKRYINIIGESSHNLQLLVDNLLEFSRMGRADMRKQVVDLNKLVVEIKNDIVFEIDGRNIVWKIAHLPSVYADPLMLRQVFINLLNNAIKFTRSEEIAEISIGAKIENSNAVIYVKDNGVGFDMKYADKLFGVFQRLHSKREFEGTGIGLANVHRIILRHGGEVWAESEVGQGATFYFSLLISKENNA